MVYIKIANHKNNLPKHIEMSNKWKMLSLTKMDRLQIKKIGCPAYQKRFKRHGYYPVWWWKKTGYFFKNVLICYIREYTIFLKIKTIGQDSQFKICIPFDLKIIYILFEIVSLEVYRPSHMSLPYCRDPPHTLYRRSPSSLSFPILCFYSITHIWHSKPPHVHPPLECNFKESGTLTCTVHRTLKSSMTMLNGHNRVAHAQRCSVRDVQCPTVWRKNMGTYA